MNPGRELGKPNSRYFDIIRQGYKEAGFDVSALIRAVKESVFNESDMCRVKINRLLLK